ncbi:MAG: AAA family ATPase [Pseudomonadota bacterium]
MPRVLLLGGPPGVGKSSVIRTLGEIFPDLLALDADVIQPPGEHVERSVGINAVLNALLDRLQSDRPAVIAWVFAREALYQPFIDGIQSHEVTRLYLTCKPALLRQRLAHRGDDDLTTYALGKQDAILKLDVNTLDTTDLTVEQVAHRVYAYLPDSGA